MPSTRVRRGGGGSNPLPFVRNPPPPPLFFFSCHPGGRSGRRTVPLPNGVARLSTLMRSGKKVSEFPATFEAGKNHPLYKSLRTLVLPSMPRLSWATILPSAGWVAEAMIHSTKKLTSRLTLFYITR